MLPELKRKKISSILYVYLPLGENVRIFPVGIAYLANYLHNKIPDIRQHILDLSISNKRDRWKKLKDALDNNRPDVLAFSWRHLRYFGSGLYDDELRNLMYNTKYKVHWPFLFLYKGFVRWKNYVTNIIENINYVKWVCHNLKDSSILMGGTAFSIFYKDLLKKMPDRVIGIIGEGEGTLLRFVKGLNFENKRIVRRKEDRIHRGNIENCNGYNIDVREDLPAINYEYIKEIFPEYFLYRGEAISVQTNRGCSKRCIYCPDTARDRNIVVCRDPSEVVEEIISIKNVFHTKEIWFPDRLVLSQDSAASFSDILNKIVAKSIDISWSGYMRPDVFTKDLSELIVKSGLSRFIVPITTGSQGIADKLKLGLNISRVIEGCRLLKEAGYCGPVDVELTVGIFEESLKDIEDIVKIYKEIKKIFNSQDVRPILNLYSVLPESELEEMLINKGYFSNGYNSVSLNPLLIKKFAYTNPTSRKIMNEAYFYSNLNLQYNSTLEEKVTLGSLCRKSI